MIYQVLKPCPLLSPYVKYYWGLDNCLRGGEEHTQRIVPGGLFEMIFYLNDRPVSSDGDHSIQGAAMVSGMQNGFYDLRIQGNLSLFAIYFYPHGLSAFFPFPLSLLFNRSIPLRDILPEVMNNLEDGLTGAGNLAERKAVAEKFLAGLLRKNDASHHQDGIRHAISLINQSRGMIGIERLASEACLSRKQFERIFGERIGASPKQFLKIVRFQHAIFQKSKSPGASLTDLAYRCGYFDQAHMIADFKSLSGVTPKQFFSLCDSGSDYFS